jgi:hypothetical protein
MGQALTASLARDGQTTPTANIPLGGFRITGLGNATSATDAAALGQVGYRPIQTQTVSAVGVVDFTLPAGFRQFRLEIMNGRVSTAGEGLVLRCGVGATFDAGASDYDGGFISNLGAVVSSAGSNVASVIPLTAGLKASEMRSSIEVIIDPGSASSPFTARCVSNVVENTGPSYRIFTVFGARNANGAKNAIRILATGGLNIVSGTFTLFGIAS